MNRDSRLKKIDRRSPVDENNSNTSRREVVGSVTILETKYEVKVPDFKDVEVDRPVYVEKEIEIPVGMEAALTKIADQISEKVLTRVTEYMQQRLDSAIEDRIKTIEHPRIVYKDVDVDRPVFKDVEVDRPLFKDREIINPVLKDVEVTNAVIKDVEVERAVFKERVVIQPVFEEVIISKPVYKDKEITVIHPKYIDMKGNPENE